MTDKQVGSEFHCLHRWEVRRTRSGYPPDTYGDEHEADARARLVFLRSFGFIASLVRVDIFVRAIERRVADNTPSPVEVTVEPEKGA
jgi:hypothetical protein